MLFVSVENTQNTLCAPVWTQEALVFVSFCSFCISTNGCQTSSICQWSPEIITHSEESDDKNLFLITCFLSFQICQSYSFCVAIWSIMNRSLSRFSNLWWISRWWAWFCRAPTINALTLDFNQTICLRAGTALAGPPRLCPGVTICMRSSNSPTVCASAFSPEKNVSSLPLKGYV